MRREGGFSLAEVMVASLIMIVITTALFSAMEQTETFYEDYSADVDTRQSARVTLAQIVDETRLAGYDVGNLSEVLTSASDTVFEFVGDIDDGDATGPCDASFENADNGGAERVSYTLDTDNGLLVKNVDCWNGSAWTNDVFTEIILRGLNTETVMFEYYDQTGTRVPLGGGTLDEGLRADVRSVMVTLDVTDADAGALVDEGRVTLRIQRHVRLENLDSE